MDKLFHLCQKAEKVWPDCTGDPEKIAKEVTRKRDVDEINEMLTVYTETMELLKDNYPKWEVSDRMDWAIARAMSPEWFGEELTTRINNTMLVSALLITVTSASLFSPPQYDHVDELQKTNYGLRVYFFVNGIANLLFIISIISGVCFVENAMSRAYCEYDKFILIIDMYSYKNLSQYTAIIGAFFFVASLFLSIWKTYYQLDCIVYTVIGAVSMIYLLYIQLLSINLAAIRQQVRLNEFKKLVVQDTGCLKKEYNPLCISKEKEAAVEAK